jgi:hypothetical protein
MEKKFALCATKTINILTRVVRKNVFNQKKPHSPLPLQVKWSVPNQIQIDELHSGWSFSFRRLIHSLKTYDSTVLVYRQTKAEIVNT